MAAGRSSRFGGCKLLAKIGETTLLQHSINTANAWCAGNVFVITGAWHNEIMASGVNNASIIYHKQWKNGLGSSIAKGINHLQAHYANVLIMLADQIKVDEKDILSLLKAHDGSNTTCSFYNNRNAVPAIFAKATYPALQKLTGDRGAQQLLNNAHAINLPNGAFDVDRIEDLALISD